MTYTPEQFVAFATLGLCILAAVTWFLYAAVRELLPKGAWYVECPDCGAKARLSRWKWEAWWMYHAYGLFMASMPGCPSKPRLVHYDRKKEE